MTLAPHIEIIYSPPTLLKINQNCLERSSLRLKNIPALHFQIWRELIKK